MVDDDFEQDSLFGHFVPETEPVVDDLLERAIEERSNDRAEFEPTEEELYEDHGTFLPGLHLEPVEEPESIEWATYENADPLADINAVLDGEGLPKIETKPWLPADMALVVSDSEVHVLDFREPEEPPDDLPPVTEEDAEAMVSGSLPPLSNPSPDDIARVPMPVIPDRPLSADELAEIAAQALSQLEEKKRREKKEKYVKRMTANADVRHPVNTNDYTQGRIIEGGCGMVDCPLCLGKTCRYCGYGCWDRHTKYCDHDITTRHVWDPEKEEYRRGLIAAELTELGVTNEQRRREMLDKIFDGEPAKTNDWCSKCNKQIKLGQMIVITSKSKYHYECPDAKPETDLGEARQASLPDTPEEVG